MSNHLIEKPIKKTRIYQGKFLDFYQDEVELPNGRNAIREYLHHPGAVAVVPILDDGRIILVRQYRYPTERALLEIPAGKLDPGETPEECLARELIEETGYKPTKMTRLTSFWTTPAFTDEVIHLYAASGLIPCQSEPDADEFLELVALTPEEVRHFLLTEQVVDSKTALAIALMDQRQLWGKV